MNTDKIFSKQGLGCMSMSEFYGQPIDEQTGIELICTAYNAGVNLFDTADIYGYGHNEKLVGCAVNALISQGINRDAIIIASKCGITRDKEDTSKRGIDNSHAYIKQACENSLNRLGKSVAYIDLYYIHRIAEKGKHIDQAMKAMAELLQEGKIMAVGLCEATPEIISKANECLINYTKGQHQLAAVQSEYSLMTRVVERNGVLKTCRDSGITFVAYSPLSRALLTGDISNTASLDENDFRKVLPRFQAENMQQNLSIIEKIKGMANEKKCSPAQLALAWLFAKPNVIPIPGTTKEKHLLTNIAAEKINLSEDELVLLDNLEEAKGSRYTESTMKIYGFDR
jgi:aryl-alcohol dehydrogenase-like predicted oxidoreductase